MSSNGSNKRPSARRSRDAARNGAREGTASDLPPSEPAPAHGAAQPKRASARRRASEANAARPAHVAPERTERSAVRDAERASTTEPRVKRVSARRADSARPAQDERTSDDRSARSRSDVAPSPPARRRDGEASDPVHELEETFDRLIFEADSIAGDPHARRRAAEALSELAARLGGYENETPRDVDAGLIGSARELLSTDYYVRQWGRLAMRNRSEQVDDFGLDRTYESRVAPMFEALYRRWFRVSVTGAARVPSEGRAMIVANHGGALPWDGLMVRTALRLEHPARREARWLAEDFVYHMPFLGAFLTRVGAVRACPENAERLLEQDEVLTVFPEGIKGIGKLYRDRYQLQRFGRGGYVKLALRTGAPIVPAGIVGSEEAYPLLLKSSRLAKVAGMPFLPITPTFPWLGPLGLVPLPSRWVIVFGEPIQLAEHGPDAAQDTLLVNRLNDEVRTRVQELVNEALGSREAAYL